MPIKRVSIIVPMLNEADSVDRLVGEIAAQDFDGEVELIVADGGSVDDSVPRLLAASRRHGVATTVLPNPSRWVSHGLNACIGHADGDLLVRLDCHSSYPADYIRLCVESSEATGAWNVGGRIVTEGRTPTERAVACAMNSPFGGIGWTRAAAAGEAVDVDTVTFGAFRPMAFARAGLYDETLVRNQDDELNIRIRRVGGRIVLDPRIVLTYTPRGSLDGVWKQYWEYGLWKVPVMLKHRSLASARSVVPLGFVGSILGLALASPRSRTARRALVGELLVYTAAAVGFAARAVDQRRESWGLVPRTAAVFPTFHAAYGLGMARGWLRAAARRTAKGARR
jgi:glycosyltransferase involved in cell wall biosynthesis